MSNPEKNIHQANPVEDKIKQPKRSKRGDNRQGRRVVRQQVPESERRRLREQLESSGTRPRDPKQIWNNVLARRAESVRPSTRVEGKNNQRCDSQVQRACWTLADKSNIEDLLTMFSEKSDNYLSDSTIQQCLFTLDNMKKYRNSRQLGNLLLRSDMLVTFYDLFDSVDMERACVILQDLNPHFELEEALKKYQAALERDRAKRMSNASRFSSEDDLVKKHRAPSGAKVEVNEDDDSVCAKSTLEEDEAVPVLAEVVEDSAESDVRDHEEPASTETSESTPLLQKHRRRKRVSKLPSTQELADQLAEIKEVRERKEKAELLHQLQQGLRRSDGAGQCTLPRRLYFERGSEVVIGRLCKVEEKCLDPRKKEVDVYDTYYLERFRRRGNKLYPVYDEYETTKAIPIEINAAMLVSLAGKRWQAREYLGKQSLLCEGSESVYANLFEGKLNLSKKYVIETLDIVFDDTGAAVSYIPEYIQCVESTFSRETSNCGRILVKDPDLNITDRAVSLLDLPWLDHNIFPINQVELQKTAWKRLLKGFKFENWERLKTRFQEEAKRFMNIGGRLYSDVDGYDFAGYANECIKRKSIPEVSSAQWMAAADSAQRLWDEDPSGFALLRTLRWALRKETHVFVKNEEYDKLDTTLRLIVSPHVFVKVVFGTVFRPVEKTIYEHEDSPLHGHLIKGKDQEEIREMIMNLSDDRDVVDSEEEHIYAELDHSAFESSQDKPSLDLEYSIYASYYTRGSLGRAIINVVHEANVQPGQMCNKFFTVLRDAMRWSGLTNTACGNAMMTAINLIVCTGLSWLAKFLVEGDDIIVWMTRTILDRLVANSIYPITYEYSDQWRDLSFCGNHYDADGTRIMPDNSTFYRKIATYFTRQPLSRHKAYELLYLRLLSAQLQYGAQPMMDLLIEEVNIQYDDVRHLGVRKKTIQQWYSENYYLLNNKLKHFKLPGDTTVVPNFHEIYDRVVLLARQKGEILSGKHLAGIATYAVRCSLKPKVSGFKQWLATGLLKLAFSFGRHRSGRKTTVDADTYIEEKRGSIVDYAASRSWYRKLAGFFGFKSLMHNNHGSDLNHVTYAQEFDVLRTEKYLTNYNRTVREIDDFARKAERRNEDFSRYFDFIT